MGKIKDDANNLYSRIYCDRWEPTGAEMAETYELDDRQLQAVKRAVREKFSEAGIMWGFLPKRGKYVMCPSHDCSIQREMIVFYAKNASKAASTVRTLVNAGINGGTIVADSGAKAKLDIDVAARKVANSHNKIRWIES